MDLTLLCTDDQKPLPPALTVSQTEDLDPHSLTENMSAYETETEVDLSDPSNKSTEPLSSVSKRLSQERSPVSDCLKPSSSGCNMSECLLICSELTPKNDDFRVCSYLGSSEAVLPLLPSTGDHISPLSESFSEFHVKQEPALTFSLIQKNSTPEPIGHTSSTSEGSTASVTEPLSISDNSRATYLLSSLWHQSDLSVSLESDTATAPVSDLHIYESETQDFIRSPNKDLPEIQCPEYQPSSQMWVNMADSNCDNHVLMCDSDKVVAQWHLSSSEEPAMTDYESDVSQHAKLRPPALDACEAGLMSVNDGRQRKTGVTDLTTQPLRSDSPVELWLDACQYLSGEDTEDRDVSDKTGLSVMQGGLTSDLSFPPRETQVSGYNPSSSEGIGWSSDDTRGWVPPVERWSSVDSWASALSDWTGIIAAPLEDFTAAFTEIGAEIDALTQALAEVNTHTESDPSTGGKGQEPAAQAQPQLQPQPQPAMGVQDQPLSQNIPDSSVLSGQSCVYLCLEATGSTLRDREGSQSIESLCDSAASTQEEKEPEEIQNSQTELSLHRTHQHSSLGSSGGAVASPGGYGVHVIPDLDLSHLGGFVESDIFISNEEDPIILNIIEDTDLEGQNTSGELITEELFGDKVCEVIDEHSVSQLGSAAEQEVKRGGGPPEVDPEGPEHATDPSFLTTHSLTNSHVPGVLTQPDPHINVQTCVSSHTGPDLDGECQVEPQQGSPQYIMPIAPISALSISSLVCQTSTSLEGDQTCAERPLNDIDPSCDHLQPCILGPTLDKASLQGDELIHEKENAIKFAGKSSPEGHVDLVPASKPLTVEEIHELGRELSNLADVPEDHFFVSEKDRVAFITLDLNDPFAFRAANPITTSSKLSQKTAEKMSHKAHKSTTSESKARSKKDKTAGHHHHHHPVQVSKKQENSAHPFSTQQVCKQQETCTLTGDNHTSEKTQVKLEDKEAKLMIETSVATEKAPNKPHGKKKKKHAPNATGGKSVGEPLVEVENGAKPKTAKARIDVFEAKLGVKAGNAQKDRDQLDEKKFQHSECKAKASPREQPPHPADHKDHQPKGLTSPLNDDIIKRRRLSADKFGKMVGALESKLPKPDLIQAKAEEPKADTGATRKKAYSEVVKQKTPSKEDPRVVQPVQAVSVSGDPQSLCLWCQFGSVFSDYTVTWSRGETVLSERKRSAGDDSRVSLTISNASHKDLGKYQCRLTSSHGSVTVDYLLTYEVLSEIVIPPSPKILSSAPVEVGSEEEDVHCSRLIFKEDFLSDQCFGDDQPVSILTEKLHFGEGMHRRAFRTKLQAGQIPLLLPGHACVLKVHNSISYGTKNNDELIQKNFSLAVEECHVQNTAREYIKAYTTAAQAVESFGEIPEIIPIYLVHRPSNDVPYATLEEELIGDFVKYSVKDGKEINLMRRDSEAGQKCCAFQHWVYQKTEGNLLVTDMQGVGMRLTDVGIATCKKGYKGFRGNCATSFIDQFKALHQCNKYCEVLGLKSLQPKPKKPASAPKPKPQPSAAPKKKPFGPTVKSKS